MHVALLYLGKGGGIAHCTYELAKALSSHIRVTCYLAKQNTLLELFEKLPCEVKAFDIKRGARSLLISIITGTERSGLSEIILEDNPDIIIDTGSTGWGNIVQKKISGKIPNAAIIHDVIPHPGLEHTINYLPDRLNPLVAEILIGLSDFSYNQLVFKYPDRMHIASKHGILLASNAPNPDSIADKRDRLLFFGRIDKYKGIQTLVDAFSIAREHDVDISLDIVGQGRIQQSVMRKCGDLGVGIINRYVTDKEVKSVVADHGIMILPYTSATQSGVAALALANGIPCISTNVGALPEQVQHGRNGLIVPPLDASALSDAMLQITSNRDIAKRMSEEAIQIGTTEYSWSNIAVRLLNDLADKLQAYKRTHIKSGII